MAVNFCPIKFTPLETMDLYFPIAEMSLNAVLLLGFGAGVGVLSGKFPIPIPITVVPGNLSLNQIDALT